MIKVEPNLSGMAHEVELVYDVGEALPFRLEIRCSHECVAEDLYRLALAVDAVLTPAKLARRGRS